MPDKKTLDAAKKAKRKGKSPSSQAGEFVREEIHHLREGKHGARSTEQAIAIGLSKARRAGVGLPLPGAGRKSARARRSDDQVDGAGLGGSRAEPSATRSRASLQALKRESTKAGSPTALARHARAAARKRPPSERSAAARDAARTKGARGRSRAAKKAAGTRRQRG